MASRSEISNEIMCTYFNEISLKRVQISTLSYILNYCKKDSHKAYNKQKGIELAMAKIEQKYENQRKEEIINHLELFLANKE